MQLTTIVTLLWLSAVVGSTNDGFEGNWRQFCGELTLATLLPRQLHIGFEGVVVG